MEYLFTGKSFYRHFDRSYLLEYLTTFKKHNGGVPQYSNIGYGVLGYVLELKTGKKVDALVHQKVLDPLHLQSTGYVPQKLPGYGERALGHAGDQPKFIRRGALVPDWQFTDIMSGSAAVYSNARDLLAYANAHLSSTGDEVLDAGLRETLKVQYERKTEAAASAWFVDEIDGHKIAHQIGLVAGYTAYIGIDDQTRTAVVVLQNNFNWTDRIGLRLLLRMAEAQKKRATPGRPIREVLLQQRHYLPATVSSLFTSFTPATADAAWIALAPAPEFATVPLRTTTPWLADTMISFCSERAALTLACSEESAVAMAAPAMAPSCCACADSEARANAAAANRPAISLESFMVYLSISKLAVNADALSLVLQGACHVEKSMT